MVAVSGKGKLRVSELRVGLQAQQRSVDVRIAAIAVMSVIRGNSGNAELPSNLNQTMI